MRSHGELVAVGVEGSGAYRAELARVLTAVGVTVIDVDRPDRKMRRMKGKSDPIDAYAAATAVLSGRVTGIPKSCDNVVGLSEHLPEGNAKDARQLGEHVDTRWLPPVSIFASQPVLRPTRPANTSCV
ncbi:hypothetical protein ACGFX8_35440 [Streptomyces sp. NPDC048362]|uniref:hypothetical protein n=1 Tax=Streptomyces sp. NPDC048362 TaxID=3365539 RepID=UPI003718A6F6